MRRVCKRGLSVRSPWCSCCLIPAAAVMVAMMPTRAVVTRANDVNKATMATVVASEALLLMVSILSSLLMPHRITEI
jgi:hypothetical protein